VLDAFAGVEYPGDVGPGVYDIHSPRVPSVDEIEALLEQAEARIGRDRLWVNPDCGLKTRGWPETRESLANMVAAAQRRRSAVPA
jgi:5-methyltetrahydropteroyltriglutamate--homocysteine methyltransferase